MATTYNIRYKNHCTPQEQIASGGRYYLDSDCGRKLTGDCSTAASLTATGTYDASLAVTDIASSSLTPSSGSADIFIFVKNTGSSDVLVSLDNGGSYPIVLSKGEAFASEIVTATNLKVKCASGETSTVEYLMGK